MMFQPLANDPSMKALGRASLSLNSILCGSRTTMSLTAENSGVRGLTTPFGGLTSFS